MARILVIDDDDGVRRVVVRVLATAGHAVRHTDRVTSALKLWRDEPADLVVTDIAMPDMTGFELIITLRAEGATVPIIAISGSLVVSDVELINQVQRLGGVQLLAKPFSNEQLLAAVSLALAVATD